MSGDALDDAGLESCITDDFFDADGREATSFAEGYVGAFFAVFVIQEYWIKTVEAGGEIFF